MLQASGAAAAAIALRATLIEADVSVLTIC